MFEHFTIEAQDIREGDEIKLSGWDRYYPINEVNHFSFLDGAYMTEIEVDVSEYRWHNTHVETHHLIKTEKVDILAYGPFIFAPSGELVRNWVNVYSIGQSYGGPEEGGWWVTVGDPIISIPCKSFEEAGDVCEVMTEKYPNTGKSSSVNGGEDWAVMVEENQGKEFPEVFPHYE